MAADTEQEIEHDGDVGTPMSGAGYRRVVFGVAGTFGFVALWWVASLFQPDFALPSPFAVGDAFYAELASGDMATALGQSVQHWLPGTVIGTTLGVAAGVALGWSGVLDDFSAPLVRLLRPVPPLALIGFAIAWFDINNAGAAFMIAIGAFWINFYAAYGGVEGVSEYLLDAARSLGVRGDLELVRSVVPAVSPQILTGVRTRIGRCWMLVVASEIFGVPGIGRRTWRASNSLQVDVVIAYILVLSLMFLVVETAFRAVQRRVLR